MSGLSYDLTPQVRYDHLPQNQPPSCEQGTITLDANRLYDLANNDALAAFFLVSKPLAEHVTALWCARSDADQLPADEMLRRRDVMMGFLSGCLVDMKLPPPFDRCYSTKIVAAYRSISPETNEAITQNIRDFQSDLVFRDIGFARDMERQTDR